MALQPGVRGGVLVVGKRVEQMPVEFGDALAVEAAHHGQEARLVRGDREVGGPEQEGLVALIGAAVDQVGRLGIGARHDDAGNRHDVQLEAGGVEPLDLLVGRDQHLAALVAALLGSGSLVLDVVAGYPRLDESPNQVAYVGIAAVSGIGVGDDEGPVVHRRGGGPLLVGHLQAQVLLIAVGGQQGTHQAGCLVGHLAERITGQVRAWILGRGTLGRGRPAPEVDALDAAALHGDRLAR